MRSRIHTDFSFHKLFSLVLLLSVLNAPLTSAKALANTPFLFGAENLTVSKKLMKIAQATSADVNIPNCPDAGGILRGTARLNAAGAKSAVLSAAGSEGALVIEAKITGYVDDAAELTHFDISGTAAENGAGVANFSVEESKIAAAGSTAILQGRTMISVVANADAKTAGRVDEATRNAVRTIVEQASNKFRAAREQWRGGACVEIKLTAPKARLASGEKIVVTAESRHKLDKIAFPAKLVKKEANNSATPDEQPGAPQARFTLTAPTNGEKAMIAVESVSKRGIGQGKLEFEANAVVARKPAAGKTQPSAPTPKRAASCGAWSGKITAVKRKKTEKTNPASGRLLRHIERDEEIFNVEYHVLGIADTSQRLTNAYFADAKLNFRSTRYTEDFYAADKRSCDKQIITATLLRTMETAMNASSDKRLTVYITSRGEKGHLTMSSPEVNAERIITRKYESSCPSYDQVNSGVDRDDHLIEIVSPSFEIAFELDADSDRRLNGSKTIQENDGTEIIVTWALTRECR